MLSLLTYMNAGPPGHVTYMNAGPLHYMNAGPPQCGASTMRFFSGPPSYVTCMNAGPPNSCMWGGPRVNVSWHGSHVTHVNESCCTHERALSHIRMSDVTHMNATWMKLRMNYVTHMNVQAPVLVVLLQCDTCRNAAACTCDAPAQLRERYVWI